MALLSGFRPELFEFEAVRIEVTGAGDGEGAVAATADAASHLRVVRDARFPEVKEAIVGVLATTAR
jgi:hypothetical protein